MNTNDISTSQNEYNYSQINSLNEKQTNTLDGLQDAISQAYRRKMERRNQVVKSGFTQKAKPEVQPTAVKTTETKKTATKAAPKNTGVNWDLINNLPHNREADRAIYSDNDGFTYAQPDVTKNL